MIISSSPLTRRCPLGIRLEANVPARSRGWSRRTSPTSVATVLGLVPLREFPEPRPGRIMTLVAEMIGQLHVHPGLKSVLDHPGQEPIRARQRPRCPAAAINDRNASSETNSRRNARASPAGSTTPPTSSRSCSATVTVKLLQLKTTDLHKTSDTPSPARRCGAGGETMVKSPIQQRSGPLTLQVRGPPMQGA